MKTIPFGTPVRMPLKQEDSYLITPKIDGHPAFLVFDRKNASRIAPIVGSRAAKAIKVEDILGNRWKLKPSSCGESCFCALTAKLVIS